MPSVPTSLAVVAQEIGTTILTWTNYGPYLTLEAERKISGGSYAVIGTPAPSAETYTDGSSLTVNSTYYWRIHATWVEDNGYSNEDYCTQWTATPSSDTMDLSDSVTVAVSFVETRSDTMGLSEATTVEHTPGGEPPGEPQSYEVTETDTLTLIDSYELALIGAQNWKLYLGSNVGTIHPYETTQYGDAGADIPCYRRTKELDFSDQFPEHIDTWKTISRIWLDYIDLGACDTTISVSTDNGTTWTQSSQTLGTGSLTVKRARFDFINVTGRFFMIEISHSSADRQFQWVDEIIEFEPHTDWFSTS